MMRNRNIVRSYVDMFSVWEGGQGGLNLLFPVPFNPSSRPVFVGSRLFVFFRLWNIVQCCIIFPFFSRYPPPWESRFPPPLSPFPYTSCPLFSRSSTPCPPPRVWLFGLLLAWSLVCFKTWQKRNIYFFTGHFEPSTNWVCLSMKSLIRFTGIITVEKVILAHNFWLTF